MKRIILVLGIFGLAISALELDEQPDVGIVDSEESKTEEQLEESFEIFQRGAVYDGETGKRRYDNYQVISVNPQTEEHLDVLQFLEKGKVTKKVFENCGNTVLQHFNFQLKSPFKVLWRWQHEIFRFSTLQYQNIIACNLALCNVTVTIAIGFFVPFLCKQFDYYTSM